MYVSCRKFKTSVIWRIIKEEAMFSSVFYWCGCLCHCFIFNPLYVICCHFICQNPNRAWNMHICYCNFHSRVWSNKYVNWDFCKLKRMLICRENMFFEIKHYRVLFSCYIYIIVSKFILVHYSLQTYSWNLIQDVFSSTISTSPFNFLFRCLNRKKKGIRFFPSEGFKTLCIESS